MQVPQGTFELRRHPDRQSSPLRAWDAADEYLLHHVAESQVAGERWLVVNDGFGALAVALAEHHPLSWSDSLLAHRGARENAERNGHPAPSFAPLPSTEDPAGPLDVVLVKVPRSLALLEDQLCRLRPRLAPAARVIGAAMVKHLPRHAVELFDQIIGSATTSRAWKKARLIHAELDHERADRVSPWPRMIETDVGLTLVHHAGVFSRDRLDLGARLMLEHLPPTDAGAAVVDLGCGNGVLGVAVGRTNPTACVGFSDVSYMAVASAEATWKANGALAHATFAAADGLEHVEPGTLDAVVNNPPFHEDRATGDAVAWQMFVESRRSLKPGGELRVVGNRHLGYHTKLKRVFGNCDTVASNRKFVVLSARR